MLQINFKSEEPMGYKTKDWRNSMRVTVDYDG